MIYSLNKFWPVKTGDLVRAGRKWDGGYVINKRVIRKSKNLISLGISYDWSFEKDFKSLNKQTKIFAFDFSVDVRNFLKRSVQHVTYLFDPKILSKQPNFREKMKMFVFPFFYLKTALFFKLFFRPSNQNYFFKKGIDNNRDEPFINVDSMFSYIEKHGQIERDSVFMKIDIEGSEYNLLPHLIKYKESINGMVIEFHNLTLNWAKFENVLTELMNDYLVTHIHGNNYCDFMQGTQIPDTIELTLMKKEYFVNEELSAKNFQEYPLEKLDYPNYRWKKDLKIEFI